LSSEAEVEEAVVGRTKLWNDLKEEHGPFDIIGDVHGCLNELLALFSKLGYEVESRTDGLGGSSYAVRPSPGRKAVFLGDLVDRGPDVPGVLQLVMDMVEAGSALCIPGNHDVKLVKKLKGKDVRVSHGLAESLAQLEKMPPEFKGRALSFLNDLVSHYVLDGGKLVVAHAGMKEEMQGRSSGKVREFALYGDTTGETDEFGLPVRQNWAAEYRGEAMVVYGHTPVPEAEWLNRTINIDTGCVFGGKLTALRYPEKQLDSVPAERIYSEPAKPFLTKSSPTRLTPQQEHDDILDITDVLGKRIITTRLHRTVSVREENAMAALEAMSRFGANPKWLMYLPPTMSPCETSQQADFLEHPAEAFAYFRNQDLAQVVCEEKHMGSRAIVIVCRDEESARERFGVTGEGIGICYTRTGRRFFDDKRLEEELLKEVRSALDGAAIWEELHTDWVCLDCELMPWSAKAQELLRQQYAAVGAASRAALAETVNALAKARERNGELGSLLDRYAHRQALASQYADAYRRYSWPVTSLADIKLAPFHFLASEGTVHSDKDHAWHMQILGKICQASVQKQEKGPLLQLTPYQVVNVTDPDSQLTGVRWWEELTARGGEGMVVKPLEFVARSRRGLVQPAVKCRGREYLRIIYGLEYTMPENLERLRSRGLGAKRSLALREFALGLEALERFVGREPLRRVHECVFGVLALECEPVDPRL